MSVRSTLTATMLHAFDTVATKGGVLERHPGGYWTYSGCRLVYGTPVWFVGTPTVEGLVRRGAARYTAYQRGRNGEFPIKAELIGEPVSADPVKPQVLRAAVLVPEPA